MTSTKVAAMVMGALAVTGLLLYVGEHMADKHEEDEKQKRMRERCVDQVYVLGGWGWQHAECEDARALLTIQQGPERTLAFCSCVDGGAR